MRAEPLVGRANAGTPPPGAGVYCDQSASDLRLDLVRGEIDLGQFALLDAGWIRRAPIAARACIIGASHLLRVELPGGALFHEVLSCQHPVAASPRLYRGALHGLPGRLTLEIDAATSYRFRARTSEIARESERLCELERRVAAAREPSFEVRENGERARVGLRFRFPRPAARGGEAPRTLVWMGIDAAGETLGVETAHSYPDEGRVVFSETRIRVGAGRGEGGS